MNCKLGYIVLISRQRMCNILLDWEFVWDGDREGWLGYHWLLFWSIVQWKVFYLQFHIDVHFFYIFLPKFFSSDWFCWVLSHAKPPSSGSPLSPATWYSAESGWSSVLCVSLNSCVSVWNLYCFVVSAADALVFMVCCRLLNVFLKQATLKLFQALPIHFCCSTSFA